MKTIRYGMFETNSSSTHAIGIVRYNQQYLIPETIKFLDNIQFSWEHELYDDYDSKFTYLILAMNNLKYPDFSAGIRLIIDALKHAGVKHIICPEVKAIQNSRKMNEGSVNEVKIQIKNEKENGDYSYIDHGDDYVYAFYKDGYDKNHNFLRGILTNEGRIQRFILGDSWITTSNDNDGDGYLLPALNSVYGEITGYYDENDPEMEEFCKHYNKLSDKYDIYFK